MVAFRPSYRQIACHMLTLRPCGAAPVPGPPGSPAAASVAAPVARPPNPSPLRIRLRPKEAAEAQPMSSDAALNPPPSPFRVHLRVVAAMLRREMSTRYGRTSGGYLWAVAEPAGMILMLSFAFALLMRKPDLGESFIVFFATGFLSFNFYRMTATQMSTAVRGNRALLRYPNVAPIDALSARMVLQTLTNFMVMAVILGVAVAWTGERVRLDFGPIALALSAATVLAAGVGTVNAVLFHMYPLYEKFFNIVNRPLFIISGVLYTPESLPSSMQSVIAWNPLVHVVATFRQGIFPVYHATVNVIAYPLLLGLVLLLLGLLLLRRHGERLLDQ